MANPSLSGFGHAPCSQAIVLTTGILSILTLASRASRTGAINKHAGFFALSGIAFGGPAELLFGTFLLWYFRIIERQIGSAKYAAFVAVVSAVSTLIQTVVSRRLQVSCPGGPYGLIFASFVQYFFTVPSLSKFSVLGWRLNDKAFIYLAGLQLCMSGGVKTMVAGMSGLLAGVIYRSNVLGVRNLKVPRWLCRLASSTVGRLLDSTPPEANPAAPPRGAASA